MSRTPDEKLAALASEFERLDEMIEALMKAHPEVDCDAIPGYADADARRTQVLDEVSRIPATSLAAVQDKARVLSKEFGENFNRRVRAARV